MLSRCRNPALIASSRLRCPSRSIWSPSFTTCKVPRNRKGLGLGLSCARDGLWETSLSHWVVCADNYRNQRRNAGVVRDCESNELIAGADIVDEEAFDGDDDGSLESVNPVQHGRQESGNLESLDVAGELQLGRSPIEILESVVDWRTPAAFWAVVDYLQSHGRISETLEVFGWWKRQDEYRPCELHYTKLIRMLGQAHMPIEARSLLVEMCDLNLRPSVATYTYVLQSFAERGLFEEAESILSDMVLSVDAKPNTITYTGLIHAYGKHGMYDSMWRTFNRMKTHHVPADGFTYRALIRGYAQGGLLNRMQLTVKEMSRNGMCPDSATMNAVVVAYAEAGQVKEMENQFEILTKQLSFVALEKTVKAMVWVYVKNSLFFQLSGFVKRVGLTRRTMGNYLWNSLLLSRAGNFAMKELRVEFENMNDAGFYPDVTTCNIMVLAYSRMNQFTELHEFIVTMQNNGVAPDLVTYGAVIDVFVDEKTRPKLLEELVEFRNLDVVAEVETDPVVFLIFGKGRFHLACEALARNVEEQGAVDQRTYSDLIGIFLQSLNKLKRFTKKPVALTFFGG